MKILFCIDHLRPDGTQRVLGQLVEGLSERGHCIAVLCLNNSFDDQLVAYLRHSGATVRFVGRAALLGGYGLLTTLTWIHRERFDVAITLLFFSDVVGRILARLGRVPRIVSSLRARNSNYRLWQLLLVRSTIPLADAVILNSRAVSAFAVAAEGVHPDKLVYIPNGIDIDAFTNSIDRTQLRAELGLLPEHLLIGSVGRMTRQKGFDILLEAITLCRRADFDLLLIGAGDEQVALQRQACVAGIAARIHFAGYRRDVPSLLGALDLYVHPARFEGMPNALLEAMAAGCPIIATNVDGNSELITDGSYGWLVPPDDPSALATALAVALADRSEAARRGLRASARAAAHFSVEAMVKAWEGVLLQNPAPPRLGRTGTQEL